MAEVKVKVTAQNEVRTGLQQALRETQQFGQQAKRAVGQAVQVDDGLGPLREQLAQVRRLREQIRAPITGADLGPQQQDDGTATTSARASSAIRGLAADLANASSPAQVFEAILNRTTTALGGLVAATAGFAIGSIIRRSLDEAAQGLENLIDRGEKLSQSLLNLRAPTTTFDQFASSLSNVREQIDDLKKATEDYKSSFKNQAVDFALQSQNPAQMLGNAVLPGSGLAMGLFDRFVRGEQGPLFDQADTGTQQKLDEARLSIRAALAQQLANEVALTKATTEEGRKQLATDQQILKQRQEIQRTLEKAGASPEQIERDLGDFDRIKDQTALRTAQDLERSLEDQAAKQRAINAENRRSLEERLARERQGLADLEQFGGAGVDLQREQTVARIAELEKQISNEKERAANEAQREAEQRETAIKRDTSSLAALRRASQSPEERRAALETEQSALANRAASLAPDDFAGRADVISEAQRIASEMAGLSTPAAGSSGASSLQRVGLASNEFFDTRRAEDPAKETRRAADFARQILQILQKGEPLVLPSTSS